MAVILIVEDEGLLRWSLARRLEKLGHTVLEAESLSEATQRLASATPDVVLLDLALPDGHGLDLVERHQAALGHTAVVVMTAAGDPSDEARSMLLGVRQFLTKPVEHDELARLLQHHLDSRPAARR